MRRRVLITVAASAALLLIAAVSLAAWLSLRETQVSSFTAASASVRVDIGNAETTPLFFYTNMSPGDTYEACFRAEVDLTGVFPATTARLYSGGVTGSGLATYLDITIEREDPVPGSALSPGLINCTTEMPGTLTTVSSSQKLAMYGTFTNSYLTGDTIGLLTASVVNTVDIKITMSLPSDASTAAGDLSAVTSWIVEDQ